MHPSRNLLAYRYRGSALARNRGFCSSPPLLATTRFFSRRADLKVAAGLARAGIVAALRSALAEQSVEFRKRVDTRNARTPHNRVLDDKALYTACLCLGPGEASLAALPIFAPVLALLKSTTLLKLSTVLAHSSAALVTWIRWSSHRILARWHGPEWEHLHPPPPKPGSPDAPRVIHFRKTTWFLLSLPLVLLVTGLVVSLERTPVWGRWRVIMLSDAEETELIRDFLAPGNADGQRQRNWIKIIKNISEDDEFPEDCVKYCQVLDSHVDWRAQWVEGVLRRLEEGLDRCQLTERKGPSLIAVPAAESGADILRAPPVAYPLSVRDALVSAMHTQSEGADQPDLTSTVDEVKLMKNHGCLVIDDPTDPNAFSIGFGPMRSSPAEADEAPGLIVVYTGLIDLVMGGPTSTEVPKRTVTRAFVEESENSPVGILNGLFNKAKRTVSTEYGPTLEQTEQLAVILSHEMGHLLLSHSLEGLANKTLYETASTIATDFLRTLLFPLTSILGPIFNDWVGERLRVSSSMVLDLQRCCENRKAEVEADLLGLRILLAAGFDPRAALRCWGPEGPFAVLDGIQERDRVMHGEAEQEAWLERAFHDHPDTKVRYLNVEAELERWRELAKRDAVVIQTS